jgi:DNA-binding transcriptional regulator YiaG
MFYQKDFFDSNTSPAHGNGNWRKGSLLNPFCHLVIKAIRVDSPPPLNNLPDMLTAYCLRNKMTRNGLAGRLGVSLGTLKNWERGRTTPNRQFWKTIHSLAGRLGVSLSTLKNWERGRTKPAKQFWPGIRSLLAN